MVIIQDKPRISGSDSLLHAKLHSIKVLPSTCTIITCGNDREEVIRRLVELKPNAVAVLGDHSFKLLTGKTSLKKWRGSILHLDLTDNLFTKLIPTHHPDECQKDWSLGAIMQFDLQKALNEYQFSGYKKVKRDLLISPTFEEVKDYLTTLDKEFAFDIETSRGQIICISFSQSKQFAISIPTTLDYWTNFSTLLSVLQLIEQTMKKSVRKIGQNILFDIQYMIRKWQILPSPVWDDTMVMQHSCYSEMPKSLAFLTSIYTNEQYYKDDLKIWNSDKTNNEMLWEYNAKDACITYEIYEVLKKEMKELGVEQTYNFVMSLYHPLLFMMLDGVRIDKDEVNKLREELLVKIKEKEDELKKITGGINIYSPKQLARFATETLNLKPLTKDGKVVMNEKSLEKLALKSPFFKDIIQLRKDRKIISTYLDAPVDVDGKWRFTFNPTGTTTGRLSSSASVFGCGTNIQNIPKSIRHIVKPTDGHMFTEIDLKGAEAMVVAYESNDRALIKLFEEGKNIHVFTAKLIWNVSEEEVLRDKRENEDHKTMYYKAKRVRHSGNYLASWKSLQEQLDISASDAKKLLEKFYASSPFLRQWHYKIENQLRKTRTIITPFGRKRVFFGRMDTNTLREAIAMIPQDTVSYVINTLMKKIYDTLCHIKSIKLCLQVHDSILIEHLPEQKDWVHKELIELAKIPIPSPAGEYSIPIEIKSGYNWRDLYE